MSKIKKQDYNLTPDEIFEKYGSSKDGLANEEAKKRLGQSGLNQLKKKQNWKWAKIIFSQLNDALVWILLVAGILALIFSEIRDATIIFIIVFINASIGFLQEWKAEQILDGIKKLTRDKARVIRNGEKKEIDSKLLVPGDVVFVAEGDNVPADGYLFESYDLRVNSFIFTGESRPKTKKTGPLSETGAPLADITNMLFMGETVATGEATFLVTGTGMETELGHIAHLTQEVKDDPTPLQRQMRTLGRQVAVLSVIIGVLVMVAGQYVHMSFYENFIFALALAVSVVPEGLPAAITVALSVGMKKLLRANVLAKKLNAVETLGSVSVICTDKTGTITRNELTVIKIVVNGEVIELDGEGYSPVGNFYRHGQKADPKSIDNLELLFKIGTLCNDASLTREKNQYKILGDPTEGALIVAGQKYNSEENYYAQGEKKIAENPFSSERMRMSVVYQSNTQVVSYVKGSPDVLLNLCDGISIHGMVQKITDQHKEEIKKTFNQMSEEALRVLGFAYRTLPSPPTPLLSTGEGGDSDEAEKDLIWVGLMAMIDPPRSDVARAIAECKKSGIHPIMITGDYEVTAKAIAEKINLVTQNSKLVTRNSKLETQAVINGKTLDDLGDREVYRRIKNGVCVFARIAPAQKLRIAGILKKYGEVIAMTGDGVNDAPALKRADIGIAMGIIGTDVSKEASDMILLDDNFASIIQGIKEGRTIFQNLKKLVHYVFSANAGELFTVIFGVLMQIPAPISAVQILAIDLGVDIFPTFAIGLEPAETGLEDAKIEKKREVMSFAGFRRIVYLGIIMATGAVTAFLLSMLRGGWQFGKSIDANSFLYIRSTTAAYAVLSMTQMANLLQSRSEKLSPFALGFFKNKYALGAIAISVLMLLSFMHVPILQKYLHMSAIGWQDWIVVLISTLAVFLWEEGRKAEK
jgi:potassium/sodium efflux P-type ATPase